ncbi:MAG: TMEM175 family protein [Pseudomonadota bacterium]
MNQSPTTNDTSAFKDRGSETTRLETFVDAAFAFALTLLVISFDQVPQSYTELVIALRATPAFLFGFLILMMFWVAHRNWSKRYGMDTTAATLISLALVFVILVYVYPLRSMATAAVSAMTNGWLPSSFSISTEAQARGLFRIYGVGFIICNVCITALNVHAYQYRDRLQLSDEEVFLTRTEIVAWLLVGSVGLLSVLLTYVVPVKRIGVCGWSYAILGVVMPVFGKTVETMHAQRFGSANN